MNNFILLEQLSHIYYKYSGLPQSLSLHYIHNLQNAILDIPIEDEIISSLEEKNAIHESEISDKIAINIIEKYSDFYVQRRKESKKIELSFLKMLKYDAKFNSITTQNIISSELSLDCNNNDENAFGCNDIIPINVRHNGFNFELMIPSGLDGSGEWIPNKTLELNKKSHYQFNIDSSGHPFAIQLVPEPYNSGSLLNTITPNPTDQGVIDFQIPSSGIWVSGIQYTTLYYVCGSGNEFGHPNQTIPLNLTIIGTNDVPVIGITNNIQSVNELVDASSQTLQFNGSLSIDDLDVGDILNKTISRPPGFPSFGSITSFSNLSLGTPITSSGNEIILPWSYNYTGDFDFLRQGSQLVIAYRIVINDGYANSNHQDIILTIIGTNDSPQILSGGILTGIINELPSGDPGAGSSNLTATGTFSVLDLDLDDTHTIQISDLTSNDYGILNAAMDQNTDVVTWVFEVNDADINNLVDGQSIEQLYNIRVTDNFGSFDDVIITITLNGSNDPINSQSYRILDTIDPIQETNDPIVANGILELPDILNFEDKITVDVDVELSGCLSGIPYSSGAIIDMLSLVVNSGNKTIDWSFNGATFDYLKQGCNLNIAYNINITEDNEGGVINILPSFKTRMIPLRYEAVLEGGTHDYVDSNYWDPNVDIPLKYGGLHDVKILSNNSIDCLALNNFKYVADGSLMLDDLRIKFHPEFISAVPDIVSTTIPLYLSDPVEFTEFLYSSHIEENDKKKFKLNIGAHRNRVLEEYDSQGDIDPFIRSTKWPAEKITLSLEPSFIGISGIHYTSGDAPTINIVNDNNQLLCDSGNPISYRNISLVDIRANTYSVYFGFNTQNISATYYQKCRGFVVGWMVDDDNNFVTNLEYRAKNGFKTYGFNAFNLIVQNREWHRDAGHAFIENDISISNPDTKIADIFEIGKINDTWGAIGWREGFDDAIVDDSSILDGGIMKVGGIRGDIGVSVCRCDSLGQPIDCGCSNYLDHNTINFYPGTDISDLEVGMFVSGPYIPYGTTIVAINPQSNAVCGPYITISHYVDDEDPVTGANFGNCTRYFYYRFTSFGFNKTNINLKYPLRSNKGQVFEYGAWDGLVFEPLFISYAYYESFIQWDLFPNPNIRMAIRILNRDPIMSPSQAFSGSSGYARSNWNRCYRPVSLSAVESKMNAPGSLINQTYSAQNCGGTYPFYDLTPVFCGLCPDQLDMCCVCSAGGRYTVGGSYTGGFNACFAEDMLDYENQTFFNIPTVTINGFYMLVLTGSGNEIQVDDSSIISIGSLIVGPGIPANTTVIDIDGSILILSNSVDVSPDTVIVVYNSSNSNQTLSFFVVPESGTGHAGNSTFPPGIVSDPLHRPLIDTEGTFTSGGYINPAVEVTRNPNKDERPMTLNPTFHPMALSIEGKTALEPFHIYQPHGVANFVFLYKSLLGWGDPMYKWDQYGNIIDEDPLIVYLEPDPIGDPGVFLPYPGFSCAAGYSFSYGKAEVNIDVILNNLHINVAQNIAGKYPEPQHIIDINNSINFNGLLLPPSGDTIIHLNNQLYHNDEDYGEFRPCSVRSLYVRDDIFHGEVNVGNEAFPWYCYERPEKVKTCGGDYPSVKRDIRLSDFNNDIESYIAEYYTCCRPFDRGCFCPLAETYDRFGMSLYNFPDKNHIYEHAIDYGLETYFNSLYTWSINVNLSQYNCLCTDSASVEWNDSWRLGDQNILFPPAGRDCCSYPASTNCPIFYRTIFPGSTFMTQYMGLEATIEYYWDKEDKFPGNDLWIRFRAGFTFDKDRLNYDYNGADNPVSWVNGGGYCQTSFCEHCTNGDTSYESFLKMNLCCSPDPLNCLSIPETILEYSEWTKIGCGSNISLSLPGDIISGSITLLGDCKQSAIFGGAGPLGGSDTNCGLGKPVLWKP